MSGDPGMTCTSTLMKSHMSERDMSASFAKQNSHVLPAVAADDANALQIGTMSMLMEQLTQSWFFIAVICQILHGTYISPLHI